MKTMERMHIEKDLKNKQLTVNRRFEAPVADVWRAWTESELLDQWWAPKPWKAETKKMDFRDGGKWLYAMVGPEGERHWCLVNFSDIRKEKSFTAKDNFCDEHGKVDASMPGSLWHNTFMSDDDGTRVQVRLTFDSEADLEKLLEMGFEQGFTMALSNLDHYLATHFRLRGEMKTQRKARVASYLNFPGNTEEAMNFYRKVFNGKFSGRGLQRFGDIEMPAGAPPMSDADKKLIIHAELTIMDGHVLMATDAPESMGFTVTPGNNMHINLEPSSKAETERLFGELSAGGKVTMPLQDMFWGAYFASFTDRYGINWMLNFQEAG